MAETAEPSSSAAAMAEEAYSGDAGDLRSWRRILAARTSQEYVDAWLELQCGMLGRVGSAVVILGLPDRGPFNPVSFWPAGQRNRNLAEIAEMALRERKSYIVDCPSGKDEAPGRRLAHPLLLNNMLHGVVVVETAPLENAQAQVVLRRLQWGCAWLDSLLLRQDKYRNEGINQDLAMMLDLLKALQEQDSLYGGALQLVNDLTAKMGLARASVAFIRARQAKVAAISHNADFDQRANLVKKIETAMDEALDQDKTIRFPPPPDEPGNVHQEHEALVQAHGMSVACSIPLRSKGRCFGVLTLEADREGALDRKSLEICKQIALCASPFLVLKIEQERGFMHIAGSVVLRQVEKLVGAGHVGHKLLFAASLSLIVALMFLQGDFRITSRAYLEGAVQNALVSPFDAFVANAPVRAGDIVEEGQEMVVMDDRDLKLEQLRLQSQYQQIEDQLRDAMSAQRRAESNILQARAEQVGAQIAYIEEQLSRTRLSAPFRGVVVSGDLSQSIGAPVQKGEILFQIAPLDSYRIVLEVDDRNIAQIDEGQGGSLVLSAFPDRSLDFEVRKITPVATTRDGRNFFRVEAELSEGNAGLRPGMEGVAKVFVDRRNLFGILTRSLVDWFRLWTWSWIP